jgi:O-antigen ligase
MLTRPHLVSVKAIPIPHHASGAPPRFVEYGYYCSIFYAILAPVLGLSVGFLGAGILAVLAVLCVWYLGPRAITFYSRIFFPLGCALSLILLQILFHDESLFGENIRPFVTWLLALIIVQSLFLRQGFLQRFGVAVFLIGLMLLPYLRMDYVNTVGFHRAGLKEGVSGLANPNDLAAWFGFCALYFTITGIETSRITVRIVAWLVTVGCLYVVGLTVSRATLLAFAITSVVALRRLLKRGFLPLLLFCVLCWVLYESGVFDRMATSYMSRATDETGRFLVWPLVIERFLQAPLLGVGVSDMYTYVPAIGHAITPHNGFLYMALASGIVPLVFLVGYWWRAARGILRAEGTPTAEAPFRLPLLIYAFLATFQGNLPFMKPWAIAALAVAIAADSSYRVRDTVLHRRTWGARARHMHRRDRDALAAHQLQYLPPRS